MSTLTLLGSGIELCSSSTFLEPDFLGSRWFEVTDHLCPFMRVSMDRIAVINVTNLEHGHMSIIRRNNYLSIFNRSSWGGKICRTFAYGTGHWLAIKLNHFTPAYSATAHIFHVELEKKIFGKCTRGNAYVLHSNVLESDQASLLASRVCRVTSFRVQLGQDLQNKDMYVERGRWFKRSHRGSHSFAPPAVSRV